jgi:hypothetical protein
MAGRPQMPTLACHLSCPTATVSHRLHFLAAPHNAKWEVSRYVCLIYSRHVEFFDVHVLNTQAKRVLISYDDALLLRRTAIYKYSGVCYNERMVQRTVFINKIRMLQRTRSYLDSFFQKADKCPPTDEPPTVQSPKMSILRTMTPLLATSCDLLWFLLGKVCSQFSLRKDCLCFSDLHVQWIKVKHINTVSLWHIYLILHYIFPAQMVVLDGNCAEGCGPGTDCVGW